MTERKEKNYMKMRRKPWKMTLKLRHGWTTRQIERHHTESCKAKISLHQVSQDLEMWSWECILWSISSLRSWTMTIVTPLSIRDVIKSSSWNVTWISMREYTQMRSLMNVLCVRRNSLPDNHCWLHHVVVHTDERPFQCAVCGDRFAQPANLKTHVK